MSKGLKDKLWRIYTGDYTDIGHRVGVAQARAGEPKHFGKQVWHVNVVNQFWQHTHAAKTYSQGLNQGYADELQAQNLHAHFSSASSLSSAQGANMSNLGNYDFVLSRLQAAAAELQQTIQRLESSLAGYAQQLAGLESLGLLQDYAEPIRAENGLKIRIEGLKGILLQILREIRVIEEKVQALKADAHSH